MLFNIRAELPDGTHRDFKQPGADRPATNTSAAADARERTDEAMRREFGADATLQWSGMVVFVNRPVPLASRTRERAGAR